MLVDAKLTGSSALKKKKHLLWCEIDVSCTFLKSSAGALVETVHDGKWSESVGLCSDWCSEHDLDSTFLQFQFYYLSIFILTAAGPNPQTKLAHLSPSLPTLLILWCHMARAYTRADLFWESGGVAPTFVLLSNVTCIRFHRLIGTNTYNPA